MRSCLRARPRPDIFMDLVPIFAVLSESLDEPLVLLVGPSPILLGTIQGVFFFAAARLV
jgi:hypothetical protein